MSAKLVFLIFFLIALAFLGIICMIIVGAIVVKEYNIAKSFEPTLCTLTDIEDLGQRVCRYCYTTYTSVTRGNRRETRSRQKCRDSHYPCYRINVMYESSDGGKTPAMYYPDALFSTKSTECSYYKCYSNLAASSLAVENYMKEFRRQNQNQFQCFHNEDQAGIVLGRKIYKYEDALIGMLIPGLATGGAIIVILIILFKTKNEYEDLKKSVVKQQSDRLDVTQNINER